MPRFSDSGADMYICQVCGRDLDSSKHKPQWRTDITRNMHAGNVCPACVSNHDDPVIGLYEHCRRESGLTGQALEDYITRYYSNR